METTHDDIFTIPTKGLQAYDSFHVGPLILELGSQFDFLRFIEGGINVWTAVLITDCHLVGGEIGIAESELVAVVVGTLHNQEAHVAAGLVVVFKEQHSVFGRLFDEVELVLF